MEKTKFKQRLMRSAAQETLAENNTSLKERFEEQEKEELTVERQSVLKLQTVWQMFLSVIGAAFALIGVINLIHPALRHSLISLFLQFFKEAGLF